MSSLFSFGKSAHYGIARYHYLRPDEAGHESIIEHN